MITGVVALVVNLLAGVLVGVVLTFYYVLSVLNQPIVVELRRPAGGHEFFPPVPTRRFQGSWCGGWKAGSTQ